MTRISLFILANLLVMLLLSLTARLLGFDRYLTAHGLDLRALLGFSLVLGLGGSFISLLLSKQLASWTLGLMILTPDSKGFKTKTEAEIDQFLFSTVKKYADQAGIAMPQVAFYEGHPNAFATGPSKNSAIVAVSRGFIEELSRAEQEAVIAHEVAHIANGDMVTMTLIQGVLNTFVVFPSRLVSYALDGSFRRDEDLNLRPGWAYAVTTFVLQSLLGLGAAVVVAWFSRRREFRADADAARMMSRTEPMIQALARLAKLKTSPLHKSMAVMAITGSVNQWLATHPPLSDRIARLKSL